MTKTIKIGNFTEESGVNTAKRAELLDQTKWAHDFSWTEIENLATYLRLFKIPKDTIILKEGETDPFIAIVINGNAEVHKESPNSESKIICILGPGQAIGEMSVIDGHNASATVITLSDMTLLIMTRNSFNQLINERPSLAVKFILKLSRILSQKLRLTSGILVDLL